MTKDKFKIGDTVYWLQTEDDLYSPDIGTVVDYNPDGMGWLKWVKYKVKFGKKDKEHYFYLGNNGSPDVFSSRVYSKKEYELLIAKTEYEEICDYGNGD